jgi:hypothetical protein
MEEKKMKIAALSCFCFPLPSEQSERSSLFPLFAETEDM